MPKTNAADKPKYLNLKLLEKFSVISKRTSAEFILTTPSDSGHNMQCGSGIVGLYIAAFSGDSKGELK